MEGEIWRLAVDDFQREREDYKNLLKAQTDALEALNARAAQAADRATQAADRATKYADSFISSTRRRGADDATILTDLRSVLGMSEAEARAALASYDERKGRP